MKPTIYTNEGLPSFWWLNPWHHARNLHKAAFAACKMAADHEAKLKAYRKGLEEMERRVRAREQHIHALRAQLAEIREARGGK